MVGFSRLMARDEAGTFARLRAHRQARLEPALARNAGRLVKLTGDGALAEFGSAVDALRAAIEFQQAVAEAEADSPEAERIAFRIGLHLGDLIVDEDDLYGDGVNIAARLEGAAPPGGILVSAALREQAEGRVAARLVPLGALPLKNIDRPVEAFRVEWDAAAWAAAGPAPAPVPPSAPALPDKPSIVVLPFQNMSGDAEQDYFADGMVEEITTALARIRWLFVIARNSAFAYKGQAVDVTRVGRELGVRYVLEGSVRRAGERIRITGQLIEAESGAHLWADRFDGTMAEVFELQDRVALAVAGAIEPTLKTAEARRKAAAPTRDLSAYDLWLRALPDSRAWSRAGAEGALRLLREALARDPDYGHALALAAWCLAQICMGQWAEDEEACRAEGVDLAWRAVRACPDDPFVLTQAAGALHGLRQGLDSPISLIERALALNPGGSLAWFWSGWLRLFAGEPDRAIEHFETSLRLDPRSALRHFHLAGMGGAHLVERRFDAALPLLASAHGQAPAFPTGAHFLAACLAHLGRPAEGRVVLDRLRALSPRERVAEAVFRRPEHQALVEEGVRIARGG